MSCFVPNCEGTCGVPFPKDDTTRKAWIESLNLADSPSASSFVCLDHFKVDDLNESCGDADDTPFDRIKCGAVPCAVRDESKSSDNTEKEEDTAARSSDEDKTTCRICNVSGNLENCIHDLMDGKISIKTVIMLCCHPLVIDKEDCLPQFICSACLKQLRNSHEFRLKCLETDKMWRKKRKPSEEEQLPRASKRICKDEQAQNNAEEIEGCFKVANDSDDESSARNNNVKLNKDDPPPLVLFGQPPPLVLISKKPPLKSAAGKYDEIERSLSEIHDDVSKNEPKIKQEFTAKVVKVVQSSRKKFSKAQTSSKTASKATNVINLPKGIRVIQMEAFESSTGMFPCTLTCGVQGSVFVLSKEYLFAFGLLKGDTRYLRCVLPSCKAKAVLTLLEDGNYTDFIDVKVQHNHRAPSEQVRKKQMFFYVMRRRMQLDKTLNIRSIYEDVCKLEPEIRTLVPLRNVINEICKHQVSNRLPLVTSFQDFYNRIEDEAFQKLHFTNSDDQFYQERFAADEGSLAVVFCNAEIIGQVSHCEVMYVDASFKIDTNEDFKYQLVTALVWIDDSYYPILFALVNKKTREIFKKIFQHLHDVLAPDLRPHEIVTDYEANLYYALGETYLDSHIGGSVYYYTQNLYKKICSLNLSRDLEVNSNFRNIYHMLLMLPLLPVNTILDGLNNIEIQARDGDLLELIRPVFDHVRTQWILNVTPELFCVHQLENRINENVIAPFKKLRDFLLLFKGKINQSQITIGQVIEKLIELESFLHGMYTHVDKKSFGRDLSSFQKKNVVKAWQFIESHPKININNFFQKVLGYIKCMENQLWIWGFYRYAGDIDDVLISASNFSIVPGEDGTTEDNEGTEINAKDSIKNNDGIEDRDLLTEEFIEETTDEVESGDPAIIMEAVIDQDGGVVLQTNDSTDSKQFEKAFLKYVHYK